MARTPNIDTEKLKAQSLQLRDAAAVHAGRIAVRAADLAEQGLDWAAPRAQAALASAIERATPLVESATDRAQAVADRAQPFLSDIHGHVVDDYLPRLNRAVTESAAALSSEGDLGERARAARSASAKALTTPARTDRCRCCRRLRPVEAQPADRRSLGRRLLGRPGSRRLLSRSGSFCRVRQNASNRLHALWGVATLSVATPHQFFVKRSDTGNP